MRKISTALALLALCAPLGAQNINQTVEVTNDYRTRFEDFQKQAPGMSVPDSLFRFDYDFDYSVFETPYRGSYEFSPYRIEVTPEARQRDGSRLYLRAGAGYAFHPQLEFAAQLLDEEDFKIGIVADMQGYAGNYRLRNGGGVKAPGYDLSSSLALNGQYLRPKARLSYHFGYEGIHSGERVADPAFVAGFNSGLVMGRIQSREAETGPFFYDVELRYRYSGDSFPKSWDPSHVGASNIHAAASFGPVLQEKYKILFDLTADIDMLRKDGVAFGGSVAAGVMTVKPHLDFRFGKIDFDAGLRMGATVTGEDRRFVLAPDVTARLALADYDMELYAGVSGGPVLQGHDDLKRLQHFFPLTAGNTAVVSREKLRIRAGAVGRWGSRLQYEFEGGYVSALSMPIASLLSVTTADLTAAYVQARGMWTSPRLEVDGGFRYAYMRLAAAAPGYSPSALTVDLRGVYNWEQRTRAGVFLQAASLRKSLGGVYEDIPGYVNLGLTGEFRFDARWTLWAEAGNLLGMAIERMPGYIEKSPYLTLGFSMKL
ncbi:MAG: hypothetical protein GXY24_07025 [Bacteroidales bacterium]|jgi:hypothetical protein|nr:hypothetical protein [Bacteroidales bacterium]